MTEHAPPRPVDELAQARRARAAAGGHISLEQRMNPLHLRQRRGIESEGEAPVFGQGLTFFHLENWFSFHKALRLFLRLGRLERRARSNCFDIRRRHNRVFMPSLPGVLQGFKILQLSDIHIDLSPEFPHILCERVRDLDYDICVLTGDYRYMTSGPYEKALKGMEELCLFLKKPIYGVLGNHDSVAMVPALEQMGVHLLLNESTVLQHRGENIHLAGIDDPHFSAPIIWKRPVC